MDPQTYDAMMTLLREIDQKADGMLKRQDFTNGRVTTLERKVSLLDWVVFIGGAGLVSAVVYLAIQHMVWMK